MRSKIGRTDAKTSFESDVSTIFLGSNRGFWHLASFKPFANMFAHSLLIMLSFSSFQIRFEPNSVRVSLLALISSDSMIVTNSRVRSATATGSRVRRGARRVNERDDFCVKTPQLRLGWRKCAVNTAFGDLAAPTGASILCINGMMPRPAKCRAIRISKPAAITSPACPHAFCRRCPGKVQFTGLFPWQGWRLILEYE